MRSVLAKLCDDAAENAGERVFARLLRRDARRSQRYKLIARESFVTFSLTFACPVMRHFRGQSIRHFDQVRILVGAHKADFALVSAEADSSLLQPCI